MRMLYKYPQATYPYEDLVVTNRGPAEAPLDVLASVWFRNTWAWAPTPGAERPVLADGGPGKISISHPQLGQWVLWVDPGAECLFTENETNAARLFGGRNRTPYVKDGIDSCVAHGNTDAVNPARTGTKAAARHRLLVPAGGSATVRWRLRRPGTAAPPGGELGPGTGAVAARRRAEADEFYRAITPPGADAEGAMIMRRARGPVWFPINLLIVRALLTYYLYYGDDFTIECPTGSGRQMTLFEVAREISDRLISIFRRDGTGRGPVYGGMATFQDDPHWRDLLLFHEYSHGDNGAGIGASHQTGWTGAVARLIQLFGSTGPAEMLHGPPLPLARAYQPPGVSPAAATPGPTGDGARPAGTTAVLRPPPCRGFRRSPPRGTQCWPGAG